VYVLCLCVCVCVCVYGRIGVLTGGGRGGWFVDDCK